MNWRLSLYNKLIPVCFIFLPFIISAQKNDTVYLLNGDRITGELKKYSSGLLELKTDGLSTIKIEYDKIRTLFSRKNFEIVKKNGFSYFGSIMKSGLDRNIGICVTNDTVPEPINDIVEITPVKNRFWNKFYGSVELGLSYYKSTNTLQYYLNGELNYRGRKDLVSTIVSLLYSNQKISDSLILIKKNDVSLNYSHFFQGRWWGGIGAKWQQNTELDLEYRIQLGVGAGYDIVHTNPVRFYVMGGFLVNREKPVDSIDFSSNFEGLLSLKFTWLQFRHPKIDINTNFDAFPSFTIKNRYRLEYNLSVKYEIFMDFFVALSYYNDYDSKPPGSESALNDWSVIFSIGYSF
jgi:hypothetical protein